MISKRVEDTNELALLLSNYMLAGMVVTLDGDLGAGKTTFSKALAQGLGVKAVVNSPTFTIIKEYEGQQMFLYHMDMYRMTLDEADELGLDDYFFGSGVCLIEWASVIQELLPADRLSLYIHVLDEQQRKIDITTTGSAFVHIGEQLKQLGAVEEDEA